MNRRSRSLTLALALALASLAALAACDAGMSGTATAVGTVTNSFGRPVEGASVTFANGGGGAAPDGQVAALAAGAATCTTNASGQFSCPDLAPGTYTVTITVPGYNPQTFTAHVAGDGTVTLQVPPISGSGDVSVQIINALNGDPIPNATVECRRELSSGVYSGVEFEGTTDGGGQLVLSGTFSGTAVCTVAAGGVTIPFSFEISATQPTTGTIGATPPPPGGGLRIVLTWGTSPSDLDSHLTGPDSVTAGDRFHVYFGHLHYGQTTLDLDDTSGEGPETITLVPRAAGRYRYSVHNWSDQNATGAHGIAHSTRDGQTVGTTVNVYDAQGFLCSYRAPAPTAQNGGDDANTWRVFEVDAVASGGGFQLQGLCTRGATNQAGLRYVRAADSGDMGTFLTGSPSAKGAGN